MAKRKKRTVTPVLRRGTYTADQVVDKLINVIEQEPRRLRMRWWVAFLRGVSKFEAGKPPAFLVKTMPDCGTVACAAGWVNIITRNHYYDASEALDKLVGRQDFWNTSSEASNFRLEMSELFMHLNWQAPRVVRQLRAIQGKYKDLLRSRKVVVS